MEHHVSVENKTMTSCTAKGLDISATSHEWYLYMYLFIIMYM